MRTIVVSVLFVCSIILNVFFILHEYRKNPSNGIVAQVLDGDTLVLSNGDHVRLLGVNTPERGRCFSAESTNYLSSIILGKNVTVTEEKKDNFGRRMGLVFIGDFLVNTDMVRQGLGKPDYTKNSHSQEFIAAYDEAKKNLRGVNSDICKKTPESLPPDPTCAIKGNIDKATGKKFYHLPTCSHYSQIVLDLDSGEDYFCSEQDAVHAGYIKAEGCPPSPLMTF